MGGGNISCAAEMMNPPEELTVLVDDHVQTSQPSTRLPPLLSAYNHTTMRPLFDAVHTLCCMNVIEEGISLPTIVVIGDQSSGKTSLIESLTGIDLPRGDEICTRVPLIMRIQHHSDPISKLHLEYKEKSVAVSETNASLWVSCLMESSGGKGNETSNAPLVLVVKKNCVPTDITIVDLPRIIPVHGQSESSQISDMVAPYVKLEDCIILNVISATADFLTCQSTKIANKFDKSGERTLHVFTKSDKASEDMMTIVTTNYIGPDYLCVRNRLGHETYEKARAEEARLFKTHHLLSRIDKSIVGVCVVAQKLFRIQLKGISNRFCELVGVVNEDLNTCVVEQNRLLQQHSFATVSEALPAFMQIIDMSKKSVTKLIISNEFDEFPDETEMDCKTRLAEMTKEFSQEVKNYQVKQDELFLADEIRVLEERKSCPDQVFHFLFQRKITNIIAITNAFVSRVWDYIEVVIIKVLELHAQNLSYPQLFLSLKKAAKNVVARHKERFKGKLLGFLDMKNMKGYTRDPQVISSWNELKKNDLLNYLKYVRYPAKMFINVRVHVAHLHKYPETIINEAFDIKTRMLACLEMVCKKFFDSVDLDLPSIVHMMVENEMEAEMVNELRSDGENRYKPLLKESPLMTARRWKLNNRIGLLEKLKKVVGNTMDDISFHNL
ncbi:hypothetical protein SSX86_024410 [Deinandra increscens subsp. villosa]|uniref:Dynamin-type G domain-containing protein n=1 Tax=Deinandra increscens subsp. villosa TaxID=3103831 RepID=A0AAP0GQT5_9ASTR